MDKFINYRPVRAEDGPLIDFWIQQDFWHKDKPAMLEFFMKPGCAILEDRQGPVMVVRFDDDPPKKVIIHIQFGAVSKFRIAKTLLGGFSSILSAFKDFGVEEAIFTSVNPELIAVCKKLGFKQVKEGVYCYALQNDVSLTSAEMSNAV